MAGRTTFQPWMAYRVLGALSRTNAEKPISRKDIVNRSGLLDKMSFAQAERVVRESMSFLLSKYHPIVRLPKAGGGTFYARNIDDINKAVSVLASMRDALNKQIAALESIRWHWLNVRKPEPWDMPPHEKLAGPELEERIKTEEDKQVELDLTRTTHPRKDWITEYRRIPVERSTEGREKQSGRNNPKLSGAKFRQGRLRTSGRESNTDTGRDETS